MIPEDQQDQAALYALGLLPADEADRFERAMDADVELSDFARSLREASAALAHGLPTATPPSALRSRVLAEITRGTPPAAAPAPAVASVGDPGDSKIVPFRLPAWIPWAVAASLLALCGVLGTERARLQRELQEARVADPLAGMALFNLATTPDKGSLKAQATVAWEPVRQRGILRVTGLPAPEPGTDYQLWTIGTGDPDVISGGVIHVDPSGAAQVEFHPVAPVPGQAKVFAVSLERAGGSPTHEGPTFLKSVP